MPLCTSQNYLAEIVLKYTFHQGKEQELQTSSDFITVNLIYRPLMCTPGVLQWLISELSVADVAAAPGYNSVIFTKK